MSRHFVHELNRPMSGPRLALENGRTAFFFANMVAELGKGPAPAPSGHATPLGVVLLTMMTVDVQRYQDDYVYYQENKETIDYTDLVTLEDNFGEDWLLTSFEEKKELRRQWIGATDYARIGTVDDRELMTEGQCGEPDSN